MSGNEELQKLGIDDTTTAGGMLLVLLAHVAVYQVCLVKGVLS